MKISAKNRTERFRDEITKAYRWPLYDLPPGESSNIIDDLQAPILALITTFEKHMLRLQTEYDADRAVIRRGESVTVRSYGDSPQKKQEWKKRKRGDMELKLWDPFVLNTATSYERKSNRAVRDSRSQIVSFPPGTVGFIESTHHPKTCVETCNVQVSFGGYVGWTDFRNLVLHEYEHED